MSSFSGTLGDTGVQHMTKTKKDVRTQTGTIYDKYHLPPESIQGKKIIRSMKVAARVLFARLALKKADLGSQVVVF